MRDQLRELDVLAAAARGVAIVVGAVLPVERSGGKQLTNAAVLLQDGARTAWQAKTLLPTYDVFDENRYFVPAESAAWRASAGGPSGLSVCEDAWVDAIGYALDPVGEQARAGAELALNLSASPFNVGKAAFRRRMLAELAAKHGDPDRLRESSGRQRRARLRRRLVRGGCGTAASERRCRSSSRPSRSWISKPRPRCRSKRSRTPPRWSSSRPLSCSASATTSGSRTSRPAPWSASRAASIRP